MKPCNILIIDDDIEDVQLLVDAFQLCGVERVRYVFTAMQAFIYLQSVEKGEDLPKLIVTDMYLPGITGAEFMADLKVMEQYKDIPVIVLSSTKTEKQIEEARNKGAIEYLVKPDTYDEYVKVAAQIKSKVAL